jgi:hypothetical protein
MEPITVKQLTRSEVSNMAPADLAEAFATGALADVLAGVDPIEAERRRYLDEADAARAELAAMPRTPAPAPAPGQANVDQGNGETFDRGVMRDQQRAALRSMTPQQLVEGMARGDFDELLGRK